MNGWIADLRHAFVVFRGTPVASAIAIVTLALAMAFVSAFLSLWSDLALKPPEGFEQGRRVVTIGQSGGFESADGSTPLTLGLVEGINETVNSLDFAAGVASFPQVLLRDEGQYPLEIEAVTRHYSGLEPRLHLGRFFDERDHRQNAEPVVILSHALWLERFGGRPAVLGQTVNLADSALNISLQSASNTGAAPAIRSQDHRIIGVMSPRMRGTFVATTDVWLPYEQVVPFYFGEEDSRPQFELGTGSISTTGGETVPTRMRGIARLAPGASAEAAGNELNNRLAIESQAFMPGLELRGEEILFDVIDGVVADIATHREAESQVQLFLAGTVLLAIVAACNISLFLLARATRRQRELGIRMAIGASIKRLARQLASEAGLLMLVATGLGVLASLWLSVVLRGLPFLEQTAWREISPFDWRVLAMLAVLMLLLTVLVSLAPALSLRRLGIKASSGMVTARASFGQRLAGTLQIALTGVVGAVAVAFTWHLVHYATVDPGYDGSDVLVVELEPRVGLSILPGSIDTRIVERQRQHDLIAGLPGVDTVSLTNIAPGGAGIPRYTIVQRELGNYFELATVRTDENYLDVLDIPLVDGVNMNPAEVFEILGNESYARVTFGRTDAAGEVTESDRILTGVVKDIPYGHPAEDVRPMGYSTWPDTTYPLALIETRAGPIEIRGMLQSLIDAGDLEYSLGTIRRLDDIASDMLRPDRARAALTAASALLVVVLAAFGFYGTQRYLVSAGQREYAIRSALGAGPGRLGRLVFSRSFLLGAPGLVFGGILAFIVVGWLRDGFVTAAVSASAVSLAALLVIVALVVAATLGPARQARRTAPATLLRVD